MEIEGNVRHHIRGKGSPRSPEAAIANLAARQHGVVTRTQLTALGLGHGAIDRRVTRRLLHPIHRGVFAVGHAAVSREGAWLAAVLATGADAVLSHRSAAALWGLHNGSPARPEVTAPHRRRRADIRTHRIALRPDEVTKEHGIPVTTPARTLLDLAGVVPPHQLERAMHRAEYRRLGSPLSLDALLARYPGRRGTAAMRRILATRNIGSNLTRSELEAEFLALVDAHRLPRPRTNQSIDLADRAVEADAVWPEHRLIVELDGHAAHTTRRAFEADRARDRRLQAQGWRVARITSRQLHQDGPAITAELDALLASAQPPGRASGGA